MSIDDHKRAAAYAALEELPTDGIVGLGSGSTMYFFLDALRGAITAGRRFVGVPTSDEIRDRASELGIRAWVMNPATHREIERVFACDEFEAIPPWMLLVAATFLH